MELRAKTEEIVPFLAMVLMEACTIALTILAKTAFVGGMSPFVFIVYTNALGSTLLLPFSFLFHLHDERIKLSIFTWPFIVRIFFLAFTGIFMFQNLAFVGLKFSSPIVVCAMGLLIPSFSFLLSLLLRRSSLELGRASSRAKMMGTLISISGAMVEEFYKGPYTRPSAGPLRSVQLLFVFYKIPNNWVLGGVFLAAATFSASLFNFIQMGTVQRHPQVMKVVSFYSCVGTIQCFIFSLFMERDPSAWKIKTNIDLLLIISTGIFGSVIRTGVHVKCTQMKGSFYVPLFKPFGIFWAALFGTCFFVKSLHYGSVLGAVIAGVGYYTVTWGQMKEAEEKPKEETESIKHIRHSSSQHEQHYKVPLLDEEDIQV